MYFVQHHQSNAGPTTCDWLMTSHLFVGKAGDVNLKSHLPPLAFQALEGQEEVTSEGSAGSAGGQKRRFKSPRNHSTWFSPTIFPLVVMNLSTRCCLLRNILEPLLVSSDSSSSITSLGVLILVPRSSSEASGSDSSSDGQPRDKNKLLSEFSIHLKFFD